MRENIIMSRAFPFVRIREEEWCARREISGPMGVLAFGDSSTWAIKDYEDPTHVKKLAKASHKPFEEREKEKKAGLVSLKKVLQAPSSKDKSRKKSKSRGVRELNPLSPPSNSDSNPNFAPRSAWPEGKFTIKYPKGYDPELRRFVKDHTGSAVVVTKLPAAVRQRLEDEAKAREEAEANARKEAAAVLNLDEEYLEKVRLQTETAKGRRRKFGQAASASVKSTSAPPAPAPVEKAAPDPALLASVGVDDGYMAKLAEQEAARRAVKEARAAKAKAGRSIGGTTDRSGAHSCARVGSGDGDVREGVRGPRQGTGGAARDGRGVAQSRRGGCRGHGHQQGRRGQAPA